MSDSPAVIIYGDDGIGGYEEKGTTNPLKIDPSGTTAQPVTDNGSSLTVDDGGSSLTVDGPLTDAQLRATAVPVSTASLPLPTGAATETTLSAMNGKLPASVGQKAMAASLPVVVASDQSALPVSASALPLPTGAATSALQTTGNSSLSSIDTKTPALGQTTMANSQPVVIASNQSAVPVSGPLTDTQLRAIAVPVSDGGGSLTVDGPLTDAQLRAAAVPVSAASLPLPTGAATSALQTTGNTSVSNIDTKTPALGQAAMAASTPVVIANNQSAVPVSAASLPLPTGAATEATLAAQSAKLPATLGQKAMAASLAVALASDQSAIPVTGSFSASVIPNPDDTTGTITTLGGAVTAAVEGWTSCAVVLTGTWVATLVFQFSHDGGATWANGGFVKSPVTMTPIPELAMFLNANGCAQCVGMGANTHVRIIASAYTSGTVNVRLVFADNIPAINVGMQAIRQSISASIYNNSTTNLASGASFTGSAEGSYGASALALSIAADQPIMVKFQGSPNGTNWDQEEEWMVTPAEGDVRVFQMLGEYFRVIAQNIGNTTTTYFRLRTMCVPTMETLPNALTPHGRLRLASMTSSWSPDPNNFQDISQNRSLIMDVDRNLMCRSGVLTDAESFRDDFTGTNPYVDLTGTCYFTSGSVYVTGVGTAFLSELNKSKYLKQSSHADTTYMRVAEIFSDTLLKLTESYTGATASGTGRSTLWMPTTEAGTSITQSTSEILLASGTTSGSLCLVQRYGDYLPYVIGFKARITQRIANQEAGIGFTDGTIGAAENQALVVFDGTNNTQVKLRTSFASADIETTTVTLPDSGVTSAAHYYQLEVTMAKVSLFIDDVRVAEHRSHTPGPYSPMDCHICIKNTGVPASTTTLGVDTFFFSNFDRIQITSEPKGDPVATKELRSSSPTCTNVVAAVADTSLLASNPNRLGCSIYNDSVAVLYLKLGSGASATSFTIALGRYDYYEAPANYVGRINGYWSAATGAARITELS